jgi:glycosyltransferase involved in cell wall biosynthesis
MSGLPTLSVVIPTRDRKPILLDTLRRIERQCAGLAVEVVVVDDGSTDDTAVALRDLAQRSSLSLRPLRQKARGPASARNRGIAAARGTACLFIGDDVRPRESMLERHLEFHRRHPEPTAALLGLVVPAPPLDSSPFIRWLHEDGVQFDFGSLDAGRNVPPQSFWTANVSAKTELLRAVAGFDERFNAAACEDVELGLRLADTGMILWFDPAVVGEHYHPTDLPSTLKRMQRVGRSFRLLQEKAPTIAMPRRPDLRHRVKAAALTALNLARVRPPSVRHATWRFLCDEVQRESFWGEPTVREAPRIGGLLARLAEDDPATGAPPDAGTVP